ncbi:hypothetical protein AAVH_39191, partial [Aphelenchoides avenae]
MPPKHDATKTQVNNGPGKNGNGPNSGNVGSENGDGPSKEAQRAAAVPPAGPVPPTDESNKSAHGDVPVADAFATAAAGRGLQDVEMEDASVKEKVCRAADKDEKLFYAYGDKIMQATQE